MISTADYTLVSSVTGGWVKNKVRMQGLVETPQETWCSLLRWFVVWLVLFFMDIRHPPNHEMITH